MGALIFNAFPEKGGGEIAGEMRVFETKLTKVLFEGRPTKGAMGPLQEDAEGNVSPLAVSQRELEDKHMKELKDCFANPDISLYFVGMSDDMGSIELMAFTKGGGSKSFNIGADFDTLETTSVARRTPKLSADLPKLSEASTEYITALKEKHPKLEKDEGYTPPTQGLQ
ncbi:MAG: hypothetical protein K0U37_05960 [Gammaproteobacteria bacterium]|nr:hypothetical protein [Gammaproteobacteria bacterium]